MSLPYVHFGFWQAGFTWGVGITAEVDHEVMDGAEGWQRSQISADADAIEQPAGP